jgi:hypothetical protein
MKKSKWYEVPGYFAEAKKNGSIRDSRSKLSLTQYDNGNGYKITYITRLSGFSCLRYVHRLILITFRGYKRGKQCDHKNGIRSDNRLSNLQWCTGKENMQSAISRGVKLGGPKFPINDKDGRVRLTNRKENTKKILYLRINGKTQKQIARKIGVSRSLVGNIIRENKHLLKKLAAQK